MQEIRISRTTIIWIIKRILWVEIRASFDRQAIATKQRLLPS